MTFEQNLSKVISNDNTLTQNLLSQVALKMMKEKFNLKQGNIIRDQDAKDMKEMLA